MNTRRNREARRAGDEVAEYLRGPEDFTAWLSAAGLCPAGPDPPVRPGLAPMRLARRGWPGAVSPAVAAETFALGPFQLLDVAATRDAEGRQLTISVVDRDPGPALARGST